MYAASGRQCRRVAFTKTFLSFVNFDLAFTRVVRGANNDYKRF